MILADMMRAMKAAGCTPEQIIAAVAILDEERRAKMRATNARAQRESRARRGITGTKQTSGLTANERP